MDNIQLEDFLNILKVEEYPLALSINEMYISSGCTRVIKESASGYTVSYLSVKDKKTLANFVCRKSGLKIRLTPHKPFDCQDLLYDLPENMKKDMLKANTCKRLSGENVCNPRCSMGYTFKFNDETFNKCRSMAFLFSVTEENLPYITSFIQKSLNNYN